MRVECATAKQRTSTTQLPYWERCDQWLHLQRSQIAPHPGRKHSTPPYLTLPHAEPFHVALWLIEVASDVSLDARGG